MLDNATELFWFLYYADYTLPGIIIPLVASIIGFSLNSSNLKKYWMSILVCAVINCISALICVKLDVGRNTDNSIHMFNNFMFCAVWFAWRGDKITPLFAFAATWLTLIPGDIGGSIAIIFWQGQFSNPVMTFAAIGGAGWKDTLFFGPITSAIATFIFIEGIKRGWFDTPQFKPKNSPNRNND